MTSTIPPLTVRGSTALTVIDALERATRAKLTKATVGEIRARQDTLLADGARELEAELAAYFTDLAARHVPDLDPGLIEKLDVWPDPDDWDWEAEEDLLRQLLGRWYMDIGEAAYHDIEFQLAVELSFDVEQPALGEVLDELGTKVRDISETSRTTLVREVATAREQGLSIDVFEKRLGEVFTSWSTSRAHMIALTETATAYNLASLAGYKQSGLVTFVEVLDGPDCGWEHHDDPDLAHGSVRLLGEASNQPLSHPHCQRAMAPVPLGSKPQGRMSEAAQAVYEEQEARS